MAPALQRYQNNSLARANESDGTSMVQGLVMAVITTPANESDIVHLEDVIERPGIEQGSRVRADKGYSSESNRTYLKSNKLKDGIMHKAVRNKPLGNHQLRFNKLVSQTRFKVERTFAGIARWFKTGIARYVGKEKTPIQHLMEAIAYNLYRSPGDSYVQFKFIGQIGSKKGTKNARK